MDSYLSLLLLIFSVLSFAAPVKERGVQSFVFSGDAPFTVNTATLAAALKCPNGNPTASSPPVLLVHGTGSTGEETWGEGYVPALRSKGYTACYVTLPGRAMGDMQTSSEYVAYAIHQLSTLSSGARPAIITHSQGGPVTQWALRFWPSTASIASAFIALSPDFAGIELFDSKLSNICVGKLCQASIWQQSSGSNYLAALHADSFGAVVPTTAIWSVFDGIVMPPKDNAQLPGAAVMSVQDLCPGRLTSHPQMTVDAAGFALALDALKHGGKASVSRARSDIFGTIGTCLRITAPTMSVSVANQVAGDINDVVGGFILGDPRVTKEPAVKAYAVNAS
ncbi:uncharacterized protein LTR77_000749 [Saxophila tyrrhenica]|uniref:Uncharacterized protein n=1 Tax=Saxophila tyrrhenica TaxID=1690608 RepID=A0AAV9PTF2_9PEZI|nr:hypothetical protein LTR77_000749 [Saxophila tyrrhenica]